MGREAGFHIQSWVGLLPHPEPNTHPALCVSVAPRRPLLNTQLSGLPSTVQQLSSSTYGEEEWEYQAKKAEGELLVNLDEWCWEILFGESLLCGCRAALITLTLNLFLSLILICARTVFSPQMEIKISLKLAQQTACRPRTLAGLKKYKYISPKCFLSAAAYVPNSCVLLQSCL